MNRFISVFLACIFSINAWAQETYPDKPVRIIVNVPPGGGIDAMARIVGAELAKRTGKPFVIDNRAGASGNIGAEAVARSNADGYTLLASIGATLSINDLLFAKTGFDSQALTPVALMSSVPLALIVRKDLTAKDVASFVAQVKESGGKVNIGSNGNGTASHLTAELFASEIGTRINHIPYKGTAPVSNDLLSGNIDATFIQYSAFYELHKAGKVRILAVASENRLSALPEIPTMKEAGYPAMVSNTWNLLAAPAKTPPATLQWLNKAVNAVLQDPETKARFAAMHTDVETGSIDDAKRYVAEDRARWRKVIQSAHIQLE